ncbi:Shedu anti-phage system protein SduA domain-containing protein [Pseudomonas sp. A-RE-23]|uniref:Shedu anti-phage system protein SduA domain-containing protein n=1 Tax=Pseudomonas sp. A-RE-23 TaxID=2832376 RepID=UPI001CBADBB9|nr:Shedu anti-phage system protein SduA domain-containing protein [Pseudomonas sp. A-RE-23]
MYKTDDELIKNFRKILYGENSHNDSELKANEHAIQAFMEQNSRLIPTPDILSGGVFCNIVASKLPINHRTITDFAYISVSSSHIKITLIELENSTRRIFQKNRPDKFHSDFTSALHQVDRWQIYLRDGGDKIRFLNLLKNLLPEGLPTTVPQIDYMLIISGALPAGPSYKAELNNYARHRNMKIWTYEDVIAALPYSTGTKTILSKAGDGYVVKKLGERHAQLLENCTPSILRIDSSAHKDLKLSDEVKEQLLHWQKGDKRKGDPWRVQIMGRHGFYFDMYRANKLMEVFRRSINCCEWPNCPNRIFQRFHSFSGSFVLHRYEVNEIGFWGEPRSYSKTEIRLYCDVHYKQIPLTTGRVSEMIPYPVADTERGKSFEIDALARRAVLRFIVQHCLPKNLHNLGSDAILREVATYKFITNWLMTIVSLSNFQRDIYLPLIYMADISSESCSVNPYMLTGKYFSDSFSPARYSSSLIKDQRLIESAEHEESAELARWNLRTQDENGVRMNEVILKIRQKFTLDELSLMCKIFDFKPFEDATAPLVVDLLPLWVEG